MESCHSDPQETIDEPTTPATSPARPAANPGYLRIATEEAFAPPEMLDIYRKLLAHRDVDPGFKGLMGFYMSSPSARAQHIMRCLHRPG
jgi:5-carboxyvanillate decarboxylase